MLSAHVYGWSSVCTLIDSGHTYALVVAVCSVSVERFCGCCGLCIDRDCLTVLHLRCQTCWTVGRCFLDRWFCLLVCYFGLMAETCDHSDCDLSGMSRFDGSDFTSWRECMLHALTHRGLHGPLSGDASRPCGMSDDQWQDLEEMALSTICLHLAELVFALVMDEPTMRALWQRLHVMYDGSESSRTHVRQRHSRPHRQVMCWHCGHLGHVRQRCFRRMRQRTRHGCL